MKRILIVLVLALLCAGCIAQPLPSCWPYCTEVIEMDGG